MKYYAKSVFVVLLAFAMTAVFMIVAAFMLVSIGGPDIMKSNLIGIVLFGVIAAFMFGCVRFLAEEFLFDKTDKADFQQLGGVRFGDLFEAMATGKGASWPFAKLSASRDSIRLQSPWGPFVWDKDDARAGFRRTGFFPGQWEICEGEEKRSTAIRFMVLPWHAKRVETSLKNLGYRFYWVRILLSAPYRIDIIDVIPEMDRAVG